MDPIREIVPRARILETSFGVIPIDLLFERDSGSVAALGQRGHGQAGHRHHGHEFASWSYRSDDKAFSFNALQRIVEHLPKGIYRAKGVVRLDVRSNDYGVLQVTGRRGWLRLIPAADHAEVVTEIVFIGRPDTTSSEALRDHIEGSWRQANDPAAGGYVVTDLRAFSVEFL